MSPPGLLAVVAGRGICHGWALGPGADATSTADPPSATIRGRVGAPPRTGTSLDLAQRCAELQPTAHRVVLGSVLEGPMAGFGERFWTCLRGVPGVAAALAGCGAPRRLVYNDRYLRSPLTVRLLQDTLRALRRSANAALGAIEVEVVSQDIPVGSMRPPEAVAHDWRDSGTRDAVLRGLLAQAGCAAIVRTVGRGALPHARRLSIEGDTGGLDIVLDQGFGHWRPAGNVPFDFTAAPDEQVRQLERRALLIVGDGGRPSEAFVSRRVSSP